MAVYTRVSDAALADFLAAYDLGNALGFKGIAEGVENSNYFLETDTGRYILTLFEKRVSASDLPYFIALKQHLAAKGFPCPEPIAGRDGSTLRQLEGRPAVIVSFLNGLSPIRPNALQCRNLGIGLAKLHAALADFPQTRPNTLGPKAWPELWHGREQFADSLQAGLAEAIDTDLQAIAAAGLATHSLPVGTIHADLFPDNAFFLGDSFSGAIDFYFACTGALAYDLAICLNAWAFEADGAYNYSNGMNLIAGYQSVRPLQADELEMLPVLCRGAALRFFLTRLIDLAETPADALVKPHDPLVFAKRLAFHRHARFAKDYGATPV
ncbi:MAG: homoserine kinase [Henriciella sp.]